MLKEFEAVLFAAPFQDIKHQKSIAVAVSGGPDSMALLKLLSDWSVTCHGPNIHAITVDHGLRDNSGQEAQNVARFVDGWLKVDHCVLTWQGDKPQNSIQENARHARYSLMQEYCAEHNIKHLFLAHHADDQIETFMFRLAKGSGLDGLSSIKPIQNFDDLMLCRPMLDFSKQDILQLCAENSVSFVDDPSNGNDDFARVRLRKMIAVLESEGLSFKRLTTTTKRLNRARDALHEISDESYDQALLVCNSVRIEFKLNELLKHHEEIVLRIVIKGIEVLSDAVGYGPRTERVESLVSDLLSDEKFRKRTLGGVIFSISNDGKSFILEKEQ